MNNLMELLFLSKSYIYFFTMLSHRCIFPNTQSTILFAIVNTCLWSCQNIYMILAFNMGINFRITCVIWYIIWTAILFSIYGSSHVYQYMNRSISNLIFYTPITKTPFIMIELHSSLLCVSNYIERLRPWFPYM